jgi:hypothetical protein
MKAWLLGLALLASPAAAQDVTECDRLAAHPLDPDKVAPGVPEGKVDLAAAIPACQAAVKADPKNPRLNYQLARVLGYAGRGDEAAPYREAAVAGDYPQALFVVGYIHLLGLNKAEKDACKAGELIRRSAIKGRLAGQVGFPHWSLQGRFAGCPVKQDWAEMLGFLEAAKGQIGGDFHQGLLVETLTDQVKARMGR